MTKLFFIFLYFQIYDEKFMLIFFSSFLKNFWRFQTPIEKTRKKSQISFQTPVQ